jgi:hypothetical protein
MFLYKYCHFFAEDRIFIVCWIEWSPVEATVQVPGRIERGYLRVSTPTVLVGGWANGSLLNVRIPVPVD